MPATNELIREGLLALLLLTAAAVDLRAWRIPNGITFGGAAAALALSLTPWRGPDLLHAFAGLAGGLLALLPLRALKVLGAGDVKLMAMAGAFLGMPEVLPAILFSFIAGGAVAAGFALRQRAVARMLENVRHAVLANVMAVAAGHAPSASMPASVGRFPYAIGICLGTLAWVAFRHLA